MMKRTCYLVVALLLLGGSAASAQSILGRLAERAKNAAENNVGNKIEKGMNDILDGKLGKKNGKDKKTDNNTEVKGSAEGWTCPECGKEGNRGIFCEDCGAKNPLSQPSAKDSSAGWTCPECGKEGNTGKFCEDCGAKNPLSEPSAKPAPKKEVPTAYAKSDFVPGDEIFFEDDFANEKLGEFPSRWDLIEGYAEIVSLASRKALGFTDDGHGIVIPLMKEQRAFLPDVFTLEYDLFLEEPLEGGESDDVLNLVFANDELIGWNSHECGEITFYYREDGSSTIKWYFQKPDASATVDGGKDLGLNAGRSDYNDKDNPLIPGEWNHFAFSFNKRAFKGYINGMRIINIPIAMAPKSLWFAHDGASKYGTVSNVRLAKGAVPLYDRLTSEGKIVTYAITFETGKADLKPESKVEIARIAKLMQENPSLEFEVQGHCDATGSDSVNDPLSQKRAEAIVAALVEEGIASARLTA